MKEPLSPPDPMLLPMERLREVVALLRSPQGCPWDREQTHRSLRAGLLEEAHEVVTAIEAGDDANLREELGDLLLQVVFHCQIAQEEGRFDLEGVAAEIAEKLVRRHPHVFGREAAQTTEEVLVRWEELKRAEKGGGAEEASAHSGMDGIAEGLTALQRAAKVQKRAAQSGMDWEALAPVLEKVREELGEVERAIESGDEGALEEELGDVLFAVVNVARKVKVDGEVSLRAATAKFERRFRGVEALARERGMVMREESLEVLDQLWGEVKRREQGEQKPGDGRC